MVVIWLELRRTILSNKGGVIMTGILKRVIAVRHGEYVDLNLTDHGRKQIEQLARRLREFIPDDYGVVVLTSHHSRAKQTGEIIAQKFGALIEDNTVFGYDQHKYGGLMAGVTEDLYGDTSVAIVVTHGSAPSGIINNFAVKRFGRVVPPVECQNGNGHMIDLVTGEITLNLFA